MSNGYVLSWISLATAGNSLFTRMHQHHVIVLVLFSSGFSLIATYYYDFWSCPVGHVHVHVRELKILLSIFQSCQRGHIPETETISQRKVVGRDPYLDSK